MPTLSVAMIVKNEAQDLAACLETVKGWVNEIVILDSGSTDELLSDLMRKFTLTQIGRALASNAN